MTGPLERIFGKTPHHDRSFEPEIQPVAIKSDITADSCQKPNNIESSAGAGETASHAHGDDRSSP